LLNVSHDDTDKLFSDIFYVRNHLPVPQVDAKTYRLEIDGLNLRDVSLSLEDIKKFPKVSISATIQCGGNRRTEMGKDKPVAGLGWTGGAIGNAKWTGVRLIDVLRTAGFTPEKYKNAEKLQVKVSPLILAIAKLHSELARGAFLN